MRDEMQRKVARKTLCALAAAATIAIGAPATGHGSPEGRVTLDVVDRASGATLPVYVKDGQRYVVGTPGHEYAIRIRNDTRERALVVTSVDGVNVVTGETASPDQSGYVIDAGDRVEIAGWRRSLERTSAFYFTDLGDSYAARTGRPGDVGVIGVAVFRERPRANALASWRDKLAAHEDARRERGDLPVSPDPAATEGTTQASPLAAAPKLGTGFGRDETSYAERVRFERASESPVETIAIQ